MKKLLAFSLLVGTLITQMPPQNIEILPLRPLEVGMRQPLLFCSTESCTIPCVNQVGYLE